MSETYAMLRYHAPDKKVADRIKFYLNASTRPDFEDSVPEGELSLFIALEFAEVPETIKRTGNQVTAWFEFIEEDDVLNLLRAFDSLLGNGTRYAYFSDDEEYRAYWQYRDGRLESLYVIEDDEDTDEKLWGFGWDEEGLDWLLKKSL